MRGFSEVVSPDIIQLWVVQLPEATYVTPSILLPCIVGSASIDVIGVFRVEVFFQNLCLIKIELLFGLWALHGQAMFTECH